ncbi:NAD(P)-dependent alcohol dehydrogenase [Verrucosispora sp. NA02020]|uniref:NAD(P)-dependent alcohol dehydrogenase n=1 Tax=Verrucosispora sp. NA02020 TaxID=2742132 RepID=UPI003D71CF01
MKAIVAHRYGSPDVLRLQEVDRPVPAADQLLVRVHAAALNARDWHVLRGDPYLARLAAPQMMGLRGPRRVIRGTDFAGTVEAVGADIDRFRPGDEVYGDTGDLHGAFAEYLCVPAARVESTPATLSVTQAAALPLAGNTALLGVRDVGRLRDGQHLLVNGASGGVGTFAVQIGKALGATVTAVCRTRNVDLVRSLGADHVVDYTTHDFARLGRRYDVLLDLVGNRSLADLRRALVPGGTLVLSGGGTFRGRPALVGPMALLLRAQVAARVTGERWELLATPPSRELLAGVRDLVEAGLVAPVVDRTYPLAEVPAAMRYLESEHARAKVVITV